MGIRKYTSAQPWEWNSTGTRVRIIAVCTPDPHQASHRCRFCIADSCCDPLSNHASMRQGVDKGRRSVSLRCDLQRRRAFDESRRWQPSERERGDNRAMKDSKSTAEAIDRECWGMQRSTHCVICFALRSPSPHVSLSSILLRFQRPAKISSCCPCRHSHPAHRLDRSTEYVSVAPRWFQLLRLCTGQSDRTAIANAGS